MEAPLIYYRQVWLFYQKSYDTCSFVKKGQNFGITHPPPKMKNPLRSIWRSPFECFGIVQSHQDPGIVFAKILFFHIHPWLTRKESWYVMYPHDANCKNKALLYLLKTDKANRRQNTHSRYFLRSKTISSTQCLVMANCFIRNCLIMLCSGMKRVKFFSVDALYGKLRKNDGCCHYSGPACWR